MVVRLRVGHKAPVVRVEGTIISRLRRPSLGPRPIRLEPSFSFTVRQRAARSISYREKVAGGVARPSTRALRVPSRKIKIRHFSGHTP
jgi:hypothetical protein